MSFLTPFADHRQQHAKRTDRFAPSVLKTLAKPRQVFLLTTAFIRPTRLEIFEDRCGRATSNAGYDCGKLRITEAFNRLLDLFRIGIGECKLDIFWKISPIVSERPTVASQEMLRHFLQKAFRRRDSLFMELL